MKTKFTNYSFSQYLLRIEDEMSKHIVTRNGIQKLFTQGKTILLMIAMVFLVSFVQAASNEATAVVDKVNQDITWENPLNITYGTALSSIQLNATAIGELTYTPGLGTVLNAGTHTLRVTAAATADFNEATKEVTIVVDKADPIITIESSSTFSTYADSVTFIARVTGSGGINPTGNVIFRCVITKLGEDTLKAGKASFTTNRLEADDTHSPNAIYSGDDNYNGGISNYLSHYVSKKALTITAENKSKVSDGEIYSDCYTVVYSGFVNSETEAVLNGSLVFTGEAITATSPGSYTIIPSGLTASNYDITYVNGTLRITDVLANTNSVENSKLTMSVYPNPATSDYVNFKFGLKNASNVSIDIIDMKGLLVDRAFDGNVQGSGINVVTYKNSLPNGTYIYRLKSGTDVIIGKLMIIK